MDMQTSHDIPVLVSTEGSSSTTERRISPSWSIALLKSKLERFTGVPPGAQSLTLRLPHAPQPIAITAVDEENTTLAGFPVQQYAELHVTDTRPASMRIDFSDTSAIEKYEMPVEEYSKRTDSVLAWKQRNKLGRFDPDTQRSETAALETAWREVEQRGISVDKRCKIGERRGAIKFVGEVPEIKEGTVWVGVAFDEPTGKNDGSIASTRYFTCEPNHGSFTKPDRVEVGDFPPVDDLLDEDLEEI